MRLLECRQQSLASLDRAAPAGPDRPQREPLAVVAGKPRPKPGAQERRLAGARGAENNEQARRLARFVGGAGIGALRGLQARLSATSRERSSAATGGAQGLTNWKQ